MNKKERLTRLRRLRFSQPLEDEFQRHYFAQNRFADIIDFTPLSARFSPTTTVELLNSIFSRFDELAQRHRIEKIKTVGDAYMVVSGLLTPRSPTTSGATR